MATKAKAPPTDRCICVEDDDGNTIGFEVGDYCPSCEADWRRENVRLGIDSRE